MLKKAARKPGAATKGGAKPRKTPAAKKAGAATGKRTQPAPAQPASAAQDADAIALLEADHRAVERMFEQYAQADSREEKQALTAQICTALSIHARLEDEIFYPACRERGIDTGLMDEAQVEHDSAAVLIEELLASDPEAPFHDAKVKVLGEYIRMHVSEEEQASSGIFAKAKAVGLDMSELGRRIGVRKQELERDAETRRTHPPTPRSLDIGTYFENGESNMARFNQERDDQGRFVSDDRGPSARNRDDDDRRYSRSRDDDDEGRGSMRGGRNGDDDRGSSYGRGREDDDRGYSRYRSEDRGQSRSGQGWHGDPEGHARAAERGWETRRDDDDDRGGRSGRSRDDDDRGGRQGGGGRGQGQGGWFGDPQGHSEASRRGWESRRDDDDRGSRSSRGR